MNPQIQRNLSLGIGLLAAGIFLNECRFTVEPGHTAIKFSRLTGLGSKYYREGWHLRLPYFERPIDFNIQTRPKQIKASTANRDMQNVILTLRILFRPEQNQLCTIYRYLGTDYDDKVLQSIVNETLRSIIAQYSASQLLSQRDQVSTRIRRALEERASIFKIVIDDVSITDMTFGKEYLEAVEAKQVAQQESERAKFVVEQAREAKKSIIIKALGEAKSIELVGRSAMENPSYLDVKRIEYQKEIADIWADTRNHVMLPSDILMMNTIQHNKTK